MRCYVRQLAHTYYEAYSVLSSKRGKCTRVCISHHLTNSFRAGTESRSTQQGQTPAAGPSTQYMLNKCWLLPQHPCMQLCLVTRA